MKKACKRVTLVLFMLLLIATLFSCDKGDVSPSCQHRDVDGNEFCDKCNEIYIDDVDPITSTHTHEWGEWIVEIEATCNSTGKRKHMCAKCKKSETEKIAATGDHVFSDWIIILKPTFESKGEKKRTCICGVTESHDIPVLVPTEGLGYRLIDEESAYEVSSIFIATDTEIVIPSVYKGKPVVAIGENAFYQSYNLKSVVLPDSINIIKYRAFGGCSSLTNITIPDGVKVIGSRAFESCYSLKNVEISEKSQLTSIGDNAFMSCSNLSDFNIPNDVNSIGENAFYDCKSLTNIEIPDNIIMIEKSTFSGCINLTTVSFSEYSKLNAIEARAFSTCKNLINIVIPTGVTFIGDSSFSYCINLKTINIPKRVVSMGKNPFVGCDKILRIENGVYYIGKWVVACNNDLTSVFLRDDTVGIADFSFQDLKLNNIIIPSSVEIIGKSAFLNCGGLKSVIFGEKSKLKTINDSAFYSCRMLTEIQIPVGLQKIGESAFASCENLTSIIFPKSTTFIGKNAFANCSRLTSANFEDYTGWWYGNTKILTEELKNLKSAARCLTYTYRWSDWQRK